MSQIPFRRVLVGKSSMGGAASLVMDCPRGTIQPLATIRKRHIRVREPDQNGRNRRLIPSKAPRKVKAEAAKPTPGARL